MRLLWCVVACSAEEPLLQLGGAAERENQVCENKPGLRGSSKVESADSWCRSACLPACLPAPHAQHWQVLARLIKGYNFRFQPRSHAVDLIETLHVVLGMLDRLSSAGAQAARTPRCTCWRLDLRVLCRVATWWLPLALGRIPHDQQ